jgi:hypothetical protein
MHEIVTGKLTVEQARKQFAEAMAAYAIGQEPHYVKQFVFDVPEAGTEDLDESSMAREVADQLKDEAGRLLGTRQVVPPEGRASTPASCGSALQVLAGNYQQILSNGELHTSGSWRRREPRVHYQGAPRASQTHRRTRRAGDPLLEKSSQGGTAPRRGARRSAHHRDATFLFEASNKRYQVGKRNVLR